MVDIDWSSALLGAAAGVVLMGVGATKAYLDLDDFNLRKDGLTVHVESPIPPKHGGEVKQIGWDFGDGTTKQGPTATHTYGSPGTYKITMVGEILDDDSIILQRDVTVGTTTQSRRF